MRGSTTPNAAENCLRVWHAAPSIRAHRSIQLSDFTDPPAREDSLITVPLDAMDASQVRMAVLEALLASLLSRS